MRVLSAPRRRLLILGAAGVLLVGTGLGYAAGVGAPAAAGHDAAVRGSELTGSLAAATAVQTAVPRARCGPGSAPETGLQGEVPASDRASGRSLKPYSCNLTQLNAPLVPPGGTAADGAGLQAAYYKSCAYYGLLGSGTRVVDVRDPRHPRITTTLTSPAMLDPWESLKVQERRGLLAAVEGSVNGPLFFDVYDIKADCTKPVLRASLPINAIGHEGNWSQDGTIYYATGFSPGILTAIDVTDPALPRPITSTLISATSHGLSTNAAGNRLYIVDPNPANAQNGLLIYDVSAIKARTLGAQPRLLGAVRWPDGTGAQHTIPVIRHGHPYVIVADEAGYGGARVVDIADEAHPRVVSSIRTEIQLVQNLTRANATESSTFAYNMHYCNVDRLVEPTVLACSSRASGVRVFDLRDLLRPREIAYFNMGGTPGGDGSGEMSAQVHLDPVRGELWTTDYGKGLLVARFTNGVWPFPTHPERRPR